MPRPTLLCSLFLVAACALPAPAVTDEQVGDAVASMRRYFYANQDPQTGGWPLLQYRNSRQRGGDTAMVVLALLVSGETPQDPRLARAIEYLKREELEGTYAVSLRAHVWAQLPDEYKPRLEADTRWLLAAADAQSRFRYGGEPEGDANVSTTHYGVLGVWEGAKRGVAVPDEFWKGAETQFLQARWPDGGFGYRPGLPAYGSMTAAGVTAMLIAQQQLHRREVTPPEGLARGIAAGLAWLDRRFDGPRNPQHGGETMYYLYAVERIGLASGVRYINGQDWYQVGARYILDHLTPGDGSRRGGAVVSDGQEQIDTAFALMFLARGRVPVWATKLAVPGQPTNNRPNDLYYLTSFLSDLHEGEINFQGLSLDVAAERWGAAPLAFLASDRALKLDGAQKANLKRYLDRGGLLLANADNASEPFAAGVRALAGELYPDYPVRRLPPEHPLFNALHAMPRNGQPVFGVSNGARDLILLPQRDWGYTFQAETPEAGEDAALGPAWRLASNLWVLATERGVLDNRLVERSEARVDRAAAGRVTIGRARYKGNWLPEPFAWEPMATRLFNRAGLEAEVVDLDLDRIGGSDLPLIHLAGTEPLELSDAQRDAISRYARRGGTLLIETPGGRGDFTRSLEGQLVETFDASAFQILGEEPIVSGAGLEGGYDNREVTYRRHTVALEAAGRRPRLSAFLIDGRPAVLLSREDLSLGMLDVRRWGVMGYSPESSRRIVTNVILAARKAKG